MDTKEEKSAKRRAYYQKNKEKILAQNKAWTEENKEEVYARANKKKQADRKANPEKWTERDKASNDKRKDYSKNYYATNKETYKENKNKWTKTEKGKASLNSESAKRRAKITSATPELTPAQREQILAIYTEAAHRTASTTIVWEVDHIEPISLGGAHVPENLQVVPKDWNAVKNNNNTERWPYAY